MECWSKGVNQGLIFLSAWFQINFHSEIIFQQINYQIQIQILYLPLLGHRPIQAYTYA